MFPLDQFQPSAKYVSTFTKREIRRRATSQCYPCHRTRRCQIDFSPTEVRQIQTPTQRTVQLERGLLYKENF